MPVVQLMNKTTATLASQINNTQAYLGLVEWGRLDSSGEPIGLGGADGNQQELSLVWGTGLSAQNLVIKAGTRTIGYQPGIVFIVKVA